MTPLVTLDKVYVSAALAAVEEFTYGDTIGKDWLLAKFGLTQPIEGTKKDFDTFAFDFLQNVEGFRGVLLEEHKMHLLNVRGVGYQIVPPKAQTKVAMDRLKEKVSAEIKRAVTVLQNTNESLLSLDQIQEKDEAIGKVAAITAFNRQRLLR